ncbi:hypothetical protein AaE_007426, partial [Aphanomyces astaci]
SVSEELEVQATTMSDVDDESKTAPSMIKVPSSARKPKKMRPQVQRSYLWCDASVERMFELRYKSDMATRFDSKNNYGKRVAYVMLATELSLSMQREFTSKQVQDKFAKMKTEWSISKPSLPSPTGNCALQPVPMHYDVMLEYWGEKAGYQREALMSTDDISDDENAETKIGTIKFIVICFLH